MEIPQIPVPTLSNKAKYLLLGYSWPGNIRQLHNALLYAVNMCEGGSIYPEDLPDQIKTIVTESNIGQGNSKDPTTDEKQKLSLKKLEKMAISQALKQTNGCVREAADILGVSRSTLYRKLKKYEL